MDNLFEQMANISKSHAYDVVSKQRDELLEEKNRLKQQLESANSMYEAALGMEIIKEKRYNKLRMALSELSSKINLGKLNINRDFELINAHAYASKVLHETQSQ